MLSRDSETYRGYLIQVEPNGHGWRVWARPRTPELPIAKHGSFHVDAHNAEEALQEARQKIDGLLQLL